MASVLKEEVTQTWKHRDTVMERPSDERQISSGAADRGMSRSVVNHKSWKRQERILPLTFKIEGDHVHILISDF